MLSIFLLSSVLKAVNINSFALETRLYMDAYFWNLKSVIAGLFGDVRIDTLVAIAVCTVEMLVALLALRQEYRRVSSVGFFLMLTFFAWLTGLNLFFPTIMGSIESCGCFGELIHFSPMASFVKSVVLWVLSLVPLFRTFGSNMPWNVGKLFRSKFLYVCIAVSTVLPLYSLCFFDVLSRTVYIMVFALLCVAIAVIVAVSIYAARSRVRLSENGM